MVASRTLSVRIATVLHDRLRAEAAAQGVTVSSLTVRLLLLGLDLPPPPEPSDGRIVAAVAELFDGLAAPDADLGLHRELALLLARTVERERGPAQVGAVRELRDLARQAAGESDERWRAFQARLATAVYTDEHGNSIEEASE
jgi:hypothetical protein